MVEEPNRQPTRQGMRRKRPRLEEDELLIPDIDNSEILQKSKTTPDEALSLSNSSKPNTGSYGEAKARDNTSMTLPMTHSDIEPTNIPRTIELPYLPRNNSNSGAVPDPIEIRVTEPTSMAPTKNVERRGRTRRPPPWLNEFVVSTIV